MHRRRYVQELLVHLINMELSFARVPSLFGEDVESRDAGVSQHPNE